MVAALKAAAMGSLVGTSLLTLFTLIVGLSLMSDGIGAGLLIMTLPFILGFGCALIGLTLLGLPLTAWLKRRRLESKRAYVSGGLILGALATGAIAVALLGDYFIDGLLFIVFGAFTGGATGHFWWRYARQHEVESGEEALIEVFE